MKIALGAVQFGCDYGISNQYGKVSDQELTKILALANQAGITHIDTAPAYGNSEQRLGKHQAAKLFDYISKIPPNCAIKDIISCCKSSLSSLNTQKLSTLMLHHGEHLLGENSENIYQQLLLAKQQGLCNKIGCSVYSAKQALEISKYFQIDVVQIPASIFDQEIFQDNILAQLKSKGIEVHIRSLFLQGAIFLNEKNLPSHLIDLTDKLIQLKEFSKKYKQSIVTLALAPFVQHKQIDKVILGCCHHLELKQIITDYQAAELLKWPYKKLAVIQETLIKPSLWP